ncbi:MAG: HAD-IIIA family hydrolase [Candidatus Omnitrophica bacterium]|nr:HAD-IIIA family hydrolase [Candidatus Omnitrophota bacterium]
MARKKDTTRGFKKVRLLILDVDGVLTDGRIIYASDGRDMKFFDVHDGLGVFLLHKAGIPTVIITAKGSGVIAPRARDMRVADVYADLHPKSKALEEICAKYKVAPDEICFVGDDLVDLSLLKRVGMPVAVCNAQPEVKKKAVYVTRKHGGRGAVREVAVLILKARKLWKEALKDYDV